MEISTGNEKFEEWLRQMGPQVAVLRHRIEGLEHLETSDWDVAVRDPDGCGARVEREFGTPLARVRRPYVHQRFYRWNQVDFLPRFEWHGAEYLEAKRFWAGISAGADRLWRPRLAHDALIPWMVGGLWGGTYKSRFDGLLARALAEDGAEFQECLEWAFGAAWALELMTMAAEGRAGEIAQHAQALRRALLARSLAREPGELVRDWLGHWAREIHYHWQPPFPWIAVLGPDGSGKSTLIAALREALVKSRLELYPVHWRPSLDGRDDIAGPPVTDPHGRGTHGICASLLQINWLTLRWWAARLGKPWHRRAKSALMVSDRYHADLQVDPQRYRYGGPGWWARLWLRTLPQPEMTVFLLADADTLLARKQEVSRAEIERLVQDYRKLAEEMGTKALVLDARLAVAESVESIFRAWHERVRLADSGVPGETVGEQGEPPLQ